MNKSARAWILIFNLTLGFVAFGFLVGVGEVRGADEQTVTGLARGGVVGGKYYDFGRKTYFVYEGGNVIEYDGTKWVDSVVPALTLESGTPITLNEAGIIMDAAAKKAAGAGSGGPSNTGGGSSVGGALVMAGWIRGGSKGGGAAYYELTQQTDIGGTTFNAGTKFELRGDRLYDNNGNFYQGGNFPGGVKEGLFTPKELPSFDQQLFGSGTSDLNINNVEVSDLKGIDKFKDLDKITRGDDQTTFSYKDGRTTVYNKGADIIAGAGKDAYVGPSSPLGKVTLGGYNAFGNAVNNLVAGALWAGIAYGSGQLLGGMFGFDDEQTKALSTALGLGVFSGYALQGLKPTWAKGELWSGGPTGAAGLGIGVAILTFVLMYKDVDIKEATFTCLPWQPPTGGSDCDRCGKDGLPCSEYMCRSLGQSCELLNPGSGEENCVWVSPQDVEPPVISPSPDARELTEGFHFENIVNLPPGPGFEIVGDSTDCAAAFTPLRFGLVTNEPAQCKIDIEHREKFDDMEYYVGSTNLYLYNHTEQFSLPGPDNLEGENLTISNDGKWTFFVRCKDKNGNENEAEYGVRFCVDAGPDGTAPIVSATSVLNNGCVAQDVTSANVEFYTNEPADCNWSFQDEPMGLMENVMQCDNEIYQMNAQQLYTCKTNLTGVSRDNTKYYVKCADQPNKPMVDRNVNAQSFEFNLRGSTGLRIKNLMPNGSLYEGVDPAPILLSVETMFGCDNGEALCYYSTSTEDIDYVQFFETGGVIHKQRQDLTEGDYDYNFKCVDSGGNVANGSVSFDIDIEAGAPAIARVYKEGDLMKIITVRNSECAYSFDDKIECDFAFEEGVDMPVGNSTNHVAEWNPDETYYIKCRDEFKNVPSDCSMIVQPSRL